MNLRMEKLDKKIICYKKNCNSLMLPRKKGGRRKWRREKKNENDSWMKGLTLKLSIMGIWACEQTWHDMNGSVFLYLGFQLTTSVLYILFSQTTVHLCTHKITSACVGLICMQKIWFAHSCKHTSLSPGKSVYSVELVNNRAPLFDIMYMLRVQITSGCQDAMLIINTSILLPFHC